MIVKIGDKITNKEKEERLEKTNKNKKEKTKNLTQR